MKQRLEIIKALSIQPESLLLDEPFKSIDTRTKVNLQQMLLRFWEKRKLSILLITHDPEEAVMLADRIYILSRKPARIIKEFKIDKPQYQRSLLDEDIYNIREEIINIFMDLVDEFSWERSEKTANVMEEIYQK
jgi:NitT/TauT family transport system ATP-binding protein